MRRCVFFDRDGVINEKPPAGEYITHWRDLRLIPAAIDWIRLMNGLDILVVVVTNQRGVARGRMSPEQLDEIHGHMLEALASAGAHVDDLFCCPHEKDTCACRKPRPGLILQAQEKWDIDLAASLFIGDSDTDQQLAEACGIRFVRVAEGRILEVIPAQAVLF
jgi:histidinol-phosphate phosphatase family protein